MFDPEILAFGLGVGILIGLTGIGGGSLMTPLLILVVGTSTKVAIGTDLAYGAVTKTLGGWRHLKKGTVDLGVSKWLAFGSVPGSLVGVYLLEHQLADSVSTLLWLVAGALSIAAVAVIARAVLPLKITETEQVTLTARAKLGAITTGAVLGLMLGLTSVGSGALIGPILILLFRLTPRKVVGTDVFHAAILLWSAGLAHWVSGNVDFTLMGNILIGSLPGVWIGTQLIDKVPTSGLRPTLGCVLLGSAMGVASKAGWDIPTWTIFGVPVIVGLVIAGLYRVLPRPKPITTPATTPEVVPA